MPLSAIERAKIIIRAAEGGPHLVPVNGHICVGHHITEAEAEAGRFKPPLTPEECEALLDEDVREAQSEAIAAFGMVDPDAARIELCFWRACRKHFAGVEDLAEAVRTHPETHGKSPTRALRLARAIEALE